MLTGLRWVRWLVLSTTLAASVVARAEQMVVEVIPLQFSAASEMIPVIAPLVPPPGSVTGLGSRLVIKTTAKNLKTIRETLAELDRVPASLIITVRQSGTRTQQGSGVGGSVRIGTHRREVDVYAHSRSAQNSSRGSQHIRALEGRFAFISTNESRPVVTREHSHGRNTTTIRTHTAYATARTGFEVRPTRIGAHGIRLEVAPYAGEFARDGSLRSREVVSEVSGRLGEWISLGGATNESQDSGHGTLSYNTREITNAYAVDVMVELADQ